MRLNVAPTKSNALELKRNLEFASEGFELLEQKRQILVFEMMSRLERARTIQKETDEVMARAFASLREAVLRSGTARLSAEALGVTGKPSAKLEHERVMGLDLPTVEAKVPEVQPQFAPGTGPAVSDEVLKRFHDALETVTRLAELENAIFRLARELKKTQRRVNALEKVFIPDYSDTLKYIDDALAERERETMVIMKLAKERVEKRDG